ncbi:carboxymuconolactone decarboxylase family protein [Streptosporangium sp. NPDC000396]|uniref:carboxymuconolactone decarboxylase family protein n=1 Tax=Streptosporangium sp. NPDC000396 TaxID=3366185 RepID=UPI0036AE21AB
MGRILTPVARRSALSQIQQVSPVKPGAARDLVAAVYEQVERDFGMLAPPVILHSPAPEPLAACWLILRESLLAHGTVNRAIKEVVAAAVSLGNTCPYCVGVHSATLGGLVRGRYAAEIAGDRIEAIADPGVRRIAAWARVSGTREAAARHDLPLPAGQVAELAGVAVTFQYFNRMVNIFLGESPVPPEVPAGARGGLMRLLGLFMRPTARRFHPPGASLGLLPAAPPPAELFWPDGAANITEAFARACAAVEEGAHRSVPEPVRDVVAAELAAWNGEPTGLSRAWVSDAVAVLPAAQRPAGRLALLTAMASHQVDQPVIDEFRREVPGDRALIELTSWASLAAARRVGSWLRTSARPAKPSETSRTAPAFG